MLKFGERIDPGEILFQPGTWLVRAAAIETLIQTLGDEVAMLEPQAVPALVPSGTTEGGTGTKPEERQQRLSDPIRVRIRVGAVPADKVRDVVKVAILPLAAKGAEVIASIDIVATKADGVPRRELDLVVSEGLRQLGLDAVIQDESASE